VIEIQPRDAQLGDRRGDRGPADDAELSADLGDPAPHGAGARRGVLGDGPVGVTVDKELEQMDVVIVEIESLEQSLLPVRRSFVVHSLSASH
jgi:hypothetical protein